MNQVIPAENRVIDWNFQPVEVVKGIKRTGQTLDGKPVADEISEYHLCDWLEDSTHLLVKRCKQQGKRPEGGFRVTVPQGIIDSLVDYLNKVFGYDPALVGTEWVEEQDFLGETHTVRRVHVAHSREALYIVEKWDVDISAGDDIVFMAAPHQVIFKNVRFP